MADHYRHLWRRKLLFIRMIIVEKLSDIVSYHPPQSVVSRRASVYNPTNPSSKLQQTYKHVCLIVILQIVSAGLLSQRRFYSTTTAGGRPSKP